MPNRARRDLSETLFGIPRVHHWTQSQDRATLSRLLESHELQLAQMLTNRLEVGDILDLAGIPNGYAVNTLSTWNDGLHVSVVAKGLIDARLHSLERCILALREDVIILNEQQINHNPRLGHGAVIFAHQVAKARAWGFSRIELTAARGPTMNGYYTWARLGCDGDLGDLRESIAEAFEVQTGREFPERVQTVQDLLELPSGLEVWIDHGDSLNMTFYLDAGSR
jgi:hypothetical protein